jgi:hypothetical protein
MKKKCFKKLLFYIEILSTVLFGHIAIAQPTVGEFKWIKPLDNSPLAFALSTEGKSVLVNTFSDETTEPPAWWVVGPFARYTTEEFSAPEDIESRPANPKRNELDNLVSIGGRQLRGRLIAATNDGVDLTSACGGVLPYACAYLGLRVMSNKKGTVTLDLRSALPWRAFLNGVLVGEGVGAKSLAVVIAGGSNSLLVKTWNPNGTADWHVDCAISASDSIKFDPTAALATPEKPKSGYRNVSLASEGTQVGTSSPDWKKFDEGRAMDVLNERGWHPLIDGERGRRTWRSMPQQNMPQWAWVRFAGMRKVDRVVLDAVDNLRDFTGEYSTDGGATFKTLFERKDQHPGKVGTYDIGFDPVVTDNLRVRMTKVESSTTSGFDMVTIKELEIYGDDAGVIPTVTKLPVSVDKLKASSLTVGTNEPVQIREQNDRLIVETPWYRVELDKKRPRILQLGVDATGRGIFTIRLLERNGGFAWMSPLLREEHFPTDGALKRDGNVVRYAPITLADAVLGRVALRFHKQAFDLELTTRSGQSVPLHGGVFRMDFDVLQTLCSFYGRPDDPVGIVTTPCYLHAPDCGTFRLTSLGNAITILQTQSSHQSFDFAPTATGNDPRLVRVPAGDWQGTVTFSVDPQVPFPNVVKDEPRLALMPRYALNIAQWSVNRGLLANSVAGGQCPLSTQFYGEMGVYAPMLKDNISPMTLLAKTVDRYLDGIPGHQMYHQLKVEVTPPGKWFASLESGGFLINSAWYAIRTAGGEPMLEHFLPRLEALAGHLEAHDTDGDGIVDSSDRGHWFDNYNYLAGVKEAHSTAVNYEAFGHLADLERMAGRNTQAEHWQARADLIKRNYLKMFFNPETGVIGGWRDKDGKLHDPMFPWVNGYAIYAGLVDEKLAKDILGRMLTKMKEIGCTQFQYGLPTNLLPLQSDDWHTGMNPRPWQGYMNGSITPPYSHYFIMALYRYGFRNEAEQMLWAQVKSFDLGTFNAGVGRGKRNPVGSAFYNWAGTQAVGIGYLPENWHAYATLFAGHFGIRFDKNGYSLESWSPLKGKKLYCGMPVMGKIQQIME